MVPNVFISYSHDSDAHKEWVFQFASKLLENGVDVLLDQWDINLGSNLIKFMEKGLTNADRVLVICTNNYNEKSNEGLGGVGYEKIILTAELISQQDTKKFIPCIRGATTKPKTPIGLGAQTYIDFTDDALFEKNLDELLHELHGVPKRIKPSLGKSPFAPAAAKDVVSVETTINTDVVTPLLPKELARPVLTSLGGQSSTSFFARRFGGAFPGVRGLKWFSDPEQAVKRLALLMKDPLKFDDATPMWWWRTGDLQIESFKILPNDTVQLDCLELIIDKIAAVNAGEYYQQFVYIQTRPAHPSGINANIDIDRMVKHWGYAWEEFAEFRGKAIAPTEYEDNATEIDGEVVELNNEAVYKKRFLTPYNLIIAPEESPINNGGFDLRRDQILNEMLQGTMTIEDLTREVLHLPKISRY